MYKDLGQPANLLLRRSTRKIVVSESENRRVRVCIIAVYRERSNLQPSNRQTMMTAHHTTWWLNPQWGRLMRFCCWRLLAHGTIRTRTDMVLTTWKVLSAGDQCLGIWCTNTITLTATSSIPSSCIFVHARCQYLFFAGIFCPKHVNALFYVKSTIFGHSACPSTISLPSIG